MKKELMIGICLIAILGIIFCTQPVGGQQMDDPERAKVLKEVKSLLQKNDTFKAIEFVNSQGEPETVAKRYLDLVMDFYWKEHALPQVIIFASAGIQYSITKAQELAKEESEKAVQLRSIAKTMAYNLASFTWPGWDEEGIVISKADLVTGLDAAKLNLRLALELKKGSVPLSNAYWVLGAQYLAAQEYDEAIEGFVSAKEKAQEANDNASELMNLGYIGIAKVIGRSHKVEGERQFDEAIEGLKKLNTKDAKFYINQLKTALKVFSE